MNSTRALRASKRYSEAWDALNSGELEKAYRMIKRTVADSSDQQFRQRLLDELHWFQQYEYPELKNISDRTKHEFILVTSWNHLLRIKDVQDWWATKEILSPLLGISYKLDVDINKVRIDLGVPDEFPNRIGEQYQRDFMSELSEVSLLSLHARNLFVRIINGAQVYSGGLTDIKVVDPVDVEETKQALFELTWHQLITNELSLSDLLMNATLHDLKTFCFRNGLDAHGSKYQVIQMITSGIPEEKIKRWIQKGDKSSYIRPLVKDFQLLKKYFRSASSDLFLYLRWLRETKYLGKSIEDIANEKKAQADTYNYKPMEPYRPFRRNRIRVKKRWKTKKMQLVAEAWNAECDDFLLVAAKKYKWDLELNLIDAIDSQPPSRKIVEIKNICNNDLKLIDFCYERLHDLGVDVHKPELLKCEGCGVTFLGWSVEKEIAERVGYQICFCKQCYIKAFWGSRDATKDKEKMLAHLSNVANALGTIPTGSFRNRNLNLSNLTKENQIFLVTTLIDMPFHKGYVEKFGSWLQALILAGVLEDDIQKTARGIRSIANDGHLCNSLAERTIDDWLYAHQIQHEKEPEYPYHMYLNTTKMRADWRVKDIMIEYAGLMNEPSYAAKIKTKQELANKFHLQIIIIEPQDMLDLDKKLKSLTEIPKDY